MRVVIGVMVLLALVVIWPNLVHEPLHYAILVSQGMEGKMVQDWVYPIAPYTTTAEPFASVLGALLYQLFPSIISCIILAAIFLTRKKATFLTHIILPLYLIFDLVLNIAHYRNPYSDFRLLQAFPDATMWGLIALLVIGGTVIMTISAISISRRATNI